MGVRQKNRVAPSKSNEVKPITSPPVNDHEYHGKHPDELKYNYIQKMTDGTTGRTIELRAFSRNAMTELGRIAATQLFPLLDEQGLALAVLCEMPRAGGGVRKTTLGVCFNAGKDAQRRGEPQMIMLRKPDSSSVRVAKTLLHEVAHLLEASCKENPFFNALYGKLIAWAVGPDTPFTKWRNELIGLAKGDTYAPPKAPNGDWDSYADPAVVPTFEVAEPIAKPAAKPVAAAKLSDEASGQLWDQATSDAADWVDSHDQPALTEALKNANPDPEYRRRFEVAFKQAAKDSGKGNFLTLEDI